MRRRWFRARNAAGLARAVQDVRRASGLTQDELAAAIGSSRPTLSRLERGGATSTDTVLAAMARCGYEIVVVPRGSTVTVS
ncbi:helix-turn-helix domain-containing protein [Cellulomonas hominis]